MRFLVDAQLPPALARWLTEQGHNAEHVVDCGLVEADDRSIWEHALSSGAVIVSKDEDFRSRRILNAQGPSVVWIRLGNASRRETLRWFGAVFPDVLVALSRGDTLVEIT
jgi:predicted nuclease of predicted toxin-antitoxin system